MPNSKVTFRIRPENLLPAQSGPMTISINNAEPLVANTLLYRILKQTGQKITVSLPDVQKVDKIEREMSLVVNRKKFYLFYSTNGRRL